MTSGIHAGYVTGIDHRRLVDLADRHDVWVELTVGPGDFVPERHPLAIVRAAGTADPDQDPDLPRSSFHAAIMLGDSRTMAQDVGFGIRQLVDIAERALSPGINDPTTAVQVIDQLHRVLQELVTRRDVPAVLGEDRVLLVHRPPRIRDLIREAVEEIAHHGGDAVQIRPRLIAMLEALEALAHPEHRVALIEARAIVTPPR